MDQSKPRDIKRHYLPAAVIGYFAADQSPVRSRERVVWVLRKASGRPRQASAESVGFEKSIYGYGKGSIFDHDDYFKFAEAYAHSPVEIIMRAASPWANADAWVQLAWYITIQITRGPDLEHEISQTLAERGWNLDRISAGYPLNAQRISAAVLRARWEFVWSPDRDFILGDRGITGIYHPWWRTVSYFMPLRKNFGVILGPAPHRKQLRWFNEAWHVEIESRTLDSEGTDKFNQVMWHGARSEIYGSSGDQLLLVKQAAHTVPQEIQNIAPKYEGAQLLGLTVHERMNDEMLLLRLLGGIRIPEPNGPFFLTV